MTIFGCHPKWSVFYPYQLFDEIRNSSRYIDMDCKNVWWGLESQFNIFPENPEPLSHGIMNKNPTQRRQNKILSPHHRSNNNMRHQMARKSQIEPLDQDLCPCSLSFSFSLSVSFSGSRLRPWRKSSLRLFKIKIHRTVRLSTSASASASASEMTAAIKRTRRQGRKSSAFPNFRLRVEFMRFQSIKFVTVKWTFVLLEVRSYEYPKFRWDIKRHGIEDIE
jgi:hypothetical protein